jgi:hypothetical protein
MNSFLHIVLVLPTLATPTIASNTWIVDGGGTGTHTQIQAAIGGATDGDIILVRSGTYNSFVVGNISLSILAEEGADVDTGTIRVRNQDHDRFLLLRGLNAKGIVGLNPSSSLGFYGLNNEGSIRIWECSFEGAATSVGGYSAWSGALLDHCADVAIDECTIRGAQYPGSLATSAGTPHSGVGLRVIASGVTLHHSHVIGGNGAEAFDPIAGIEGGAGVEVTGSDFFAAGSSIVGGRGGDGDAYAGGAGNGGHGLVTKNSITQVLDCNLGGGSGGCNYKWFGCSAYSPSGSPSVGDPLILPGTAPELNAPTLVSSSSILELQVTAAPGTRVFLQAGSHPSRTDAPLVQGYRLLSQPLFGFATSLSTGLSSWSGMPLALYSSYLGTVDSTENMVVGIPVKPLPPGASHRTLFMQMHTTSPAGTSTFGDPVQVLVQDCPTCLLDCDGNGIDDLLEIENGTSPDCNRNWIPDSCETDCDGNGIPDACDIADGTLIDANDNGIPDSCEGTVRVFVDGNASPGGDGLSWATAFTSLHAGLAEAELLDIWLKDVWVAGGTYLPGGVGQTNVSFTIDSPIDIPLYGGFAGNETALTQRNLLLNPTILSGDLLGNDDLDFWGDNSKTVLRIEGSGGFHRIDGFTIQGGNAGASSGGVVINGASNWVMTNCIVEKNRGVAFYSSGQGGLLVNSIFRNNQHTGPLRLTSERGGVQRVVNCLVAGNDSPIGFSTNAVRIEGPGNHEWTGCTIANNSSMGGMRMYSEANVTFTNNIVWGNRVLGSTGSILSQQINLVVGSSFIHKYNTVEGSPVGWAPGSTGADPDFMDPFGPDGISGTPDDDYRLGSNSGAVDAGRNAAIPDDTSDMDLDGILQEESPFDLGGDPRRSDDPAVPDSGLGQAPLVDMGAFERIVP